MSQYLQHFANDVVDRGLRFLNARDVVALYDDRKVGQSTPLDLSAVVPQQCDRQKVPLAGFFERHNDVSRSTAGRNSDCNVFGACLRDELAKENYFRTDIVGNRTYVRRFKRERYGWNGTIPRRRHHTIKGPVVAVRSRAAVAKQDQFSS